MGGRRVGGLHRVRCDHLLVEGSGSGPPRRTARAVRVGRLWSLSSRRILAGRHELGQSEGELAGPNDRAQQLDSFFLSTRDHRLGIHASERPPAQTLGIVSRLTSSGNVIKVSADELLVVPDAIPAGQSPSACFPASSDPSTLWPSQGRLPPSSGSYLNAAKERES